MFYVNVFEVPQGSDKCTAQSEIKTLPQCCTCNFKIIIVSKTAASPSNTCTGSVTFYANPISGNCATPWSLDQFVGFSYGYILPNNQTPFNPCKSSATITGSGTQADPFIVSNIRNDFYQIKITDADGCLTKTITTNLQ